MWDKKGGKKNMEVEEIVEEVKEVVKGERIGINENKDKEKDVEV